MKLTMPSVIFGIFKIYLININNNNKLNNISKYSFINKTHIYIDFTNSENTLFSGTYILKMIYVGTISDDKNFRGSLYNVLNATDVMTIKARQIFPCWDTSFKVTYNISIIHKKKYTILSNMPIQKKVEDKNDMMWTHFHKSPSMLPEHFMILITTLTNISSYANVTFWGRQNMTNYTRFAENIAQQAIYFLNSKSQLTKMSKIDCVVIWDPQHSSLETKGLVLIREEDIIYNEILNPVVRQLEVANFMSRKVIQFWYNDVFLWLKEGFVTFIGTYILHKIPLYLPNIMELFVVQQQQESLRFDTPSVIDPLTLTCDRNISTDHLIRSPPYYLKSPVIWYMLLYLLPQNVFWTSIQKYVDMQQINETINETDEKKTNNLWNIMQTALNTSKIPLKFDIKNMVNTIMMAKQYPIVYVTRDYLNNITVFSYLSCNYTVNNTKQHPILITYTTKSFLKESVYKYFWLCRRQKKYLFHKLNEDDWIIVNSAQPEYYRVHYDFSNWIKLTRYLNSENYTKIDVLKRAKIVDDAFYFFIHGQFNFTMFWNLVSFLPRDTDYIVWYPMIKALEYTTCTFPFYDATEVKELMIKVKKILGDLLQNIGYNEKLVESDLTKYLREEAIRWACIFNVPLCRLTVTSNLDRHHSVQNRKKNYSSNAWKEWMYCTGLIEGKSSIWNDILIEWENTLNNRFLEYLTCSKDSVIITNYLTQTRQNKFVAKIQHAKRANIFLLIIARHARNKIILDFILQNFFKFNLIEQEKISTIIVMITNVEDVLQLKKINSFVTNNFTKLINATDKKIRKRKMEHQKQVTRYGSLILG
ncbi:aminopeptidase N-like isoform X2 [Linepithema humile]